MDTDNNAPVPADIATRYVGILPPYPAPAPWRVDMSAIPTAPTLRDVVDAWANGADARTGRCRMGAWSGRPTLWSYGGWLFSYNQCIGWKAPDGHPVVVDYRGPWAYSTTTSNHVGRAARYATFILPPEVVCEPGGLLCRPPSGGPVWHRPFTIDIGDRGWALTWYPRQPDRFGLEYSGQRNPRALAIRRHGRDGWYPVSTTPDYTAESIPGYVSAAVDYLNRWMPD